jgi:hypothetical protein
LHKNIGYKYKGTGHIGHKEINEEIAALNRKFAKARDLLFDDKLESDDYKKIRKEYEDKIKRLEIKLIEARLQNLNLSSIDKFGMPNIKFSDFLRT